MGQEYESAQAQSGFPSVSIHTASQCLLAYLPGVCGLPGVVRFLDLDGVSVRACTRACVYTTIEEIDVQGRHGKQSLRPAYWKVLVPSHNNENGSLLLQWLLTIPLSE